MTIASTDRNFRWEYISFIQNSVKCHNYS